MKFGLQEGRAEYRPTGNENIEERSREELSNARLARQAYAFGSPRRRNYFGNFPNIIIPQSARPQQSHEKSHDPTSDPSFNQHL